MVNSPFILTQSTSSTTQAQSEELCKEVRLTNSGLFYGAGAWTAIYDFEEKCLKKIKEKNRPEDDRLIHQAQLKTFAIPAAYSTAGIGVGALSALSYPTLKKYLTRFFSLFRYTIV